MPHRSRRSCLRRVTWRSSTPQAATSVIETAVRAAIATFEATRPSVGAQAVAHPRDPYPEGPAVRSVAVVGRREVVGVHLVLRVPLVDTE